jgi:outer membrane protein assembly factor BamB
VLANGILWLASKEGQLTGVEATTGRVTGQMNIGSAVYISPVVAQGKMFVLTDDAKLVALNYRPSPAAARVGGSSPWP